MAHHAWMVECMLSTDSDMSAEVVKSQITQDVFHVKW